MRLRNKKTGKVLRVGEDVYIRSLDSGSIEVREDFGCGNKIEYFKTFAKMFERYEEIKEPLIKDEKVRKVVRAWAEAFGVTKVYVCGIGDGKEYIELYAQDNGVTDGRIRISIPTQDGVRIGEEYAVGELYGEEEE